MKQHAAWFVALSASLVLSGAVGGCGDDTSSPTGSGATGGTGGSTVGGAGTSNADAGNKAGSAGTGGAGGSGGSGGTGGAAGTGGTGGAPDAGGLKCGKKTCLPVDVGAPVGILPACCPMGEAEACGNSLNGLCLTQTPGTSDPSCPDVDINSQGTAPGCCAVTGKCGADIGLPFGCNDLGPLLGTPSKACGGDASVPPADTGAPDAPPADAPTTDGPRPDGTTTDGASTEGGSDAASDRAPDAPSDAKADQAG